MKKKINLLAICMILVLTLVSCSTTKEIVENTLVDSESETISEEQNSVEEDNSDVVEEVEPEILDVFSLETKANEVVINEDSVTFTDENMEEITIEKNPQRTVVLVNSYAGLWYESGGDIVGRIDSKSELPEEYLGEGIEIVGKMLDVNMEILLGLSPDLVILRQGKQSDLIPQLEENGVAYISMEYDSIEDYLKYLKVFTALNGEEELYTEYRDNMISSVNSVLERVPNENNPDVLLILGATSSLKAYSSNTANGQILEQLKANNIADTWGESDATSIEINSEYLIASDPLYILIQCMSSEEAIRENVEATYGTTDWWNSLTAVQNGNVIYLDRELFHFKPNGRYGEAYEEMAKIIYPDVFGE